MQFFSFIIVVLMAIISQVLATSLMFINTAPEDRWAVFYPSAIKDTKPVVFKESIPQVLVPGAGPGGYGKLNVPIPYAW
jgi:hypothetical protein